MSRGPNGGAAPVQTPHRAHTPQPRTNGRHERDAILRYERLKKHLREGTTARWTMNLSGEQLKQLIEFMELTQMHDPSATLKMCLEVALEQSSFITALIRAQGRQLLVETRSHVYTELANVFDALSNQIENGLVEAETEMQRLAVEQAMRSQAQSKE